MTKTLHIRPHEEVAERVLLPGDPGRALRLAQQLIDGPRMLNHNRGLWGYTGPAIADGELLTIQSTGMGGPSAAIVVEELVTLGARRLIRVGTCGALTEELALGDLIVSEKVLGEDGASRGLGGPGQPDEVLTRALRPHVAAAGTTVTWDLFYDPDPANLRRWMEQGLLAVEMEAAAVLAVARARDVAAAIVLAVTDLLASGARVRIGDEALQHAELALGAAALAALTS